MRLLIVLVGALLLAGCGAAAEETAVPASSGEDSSVPVQPTKKTEFDQSKLKPPPVVLVSQAGKQIAAQGSFCVNYVDPASGEGQGICSDGPAPVPKQMTIVHPGDGATLLIADSTLKKERTVTVRPLGCSNRETETLELPITGQLHWQVDLDPGAYQLDVFAQFESNDGRSGDLSGSLGMLVSESDARAIVPVDTADPVCPLPD
jgi:hypothetical protein